MLVAELVCVRNYMMLISESKWVYQKGSEDTDSYKVSPQRDGGSDATGGWKEYDGVVESWGMASVMGRSWGMASVMGRSWGMAGVMDRSWGMAGVMERSWGMTSVTGRIWSIASIMGRSWSMAGIMGRRRTKESIKAAV